MPKILKPLTVLQWALGVSILLHAALLTIKFVNPEGFKRAFEDLSLDIVLVNSSTEEKPTKPQALAQVNSAGGGESKNPRMVSTPLPPSIIDTDGDAPINESRQQISALLEQQEQMLTQVRKQLAAMPQIDPERVESNPEAKAQQERRQQLMRLLAAIEKRVEEENSRPRKRYLSPATLGSVFAIYYDDMRRKIEARGTQNFPEQGGNKLYGSLIMSLLINNDGRVLEANVQRTSGNRALDLLAEAIATKAGPFGEFTPEMKRETDQFNITTKFNFTRDQTLKTTLEGEKVDQ